MRDLKASRDLYKDNETASDAPWINDPLLPFTVLSPTPQAQSNPHGIHERKKVGV